MAAADVGVAQGDRALGEAADLDGLVAEDDPGPVRQDERGGRQAVDPLTDLGGHPVAARPGGGVAADLHLDGPDEHIPLVACMLPGSVPKLSSEHVGEALVALGVRGDRTTMKTLGAIRPLTPTRRSRSISAGQTAGYLHRLDPATQGRREGPSTRRSRRCSNCWSPIVVDQPTGAMCAPGCARLQPLGSLVSRKHPDLGIRMTAEAFVSPRILSNTRTRGAERRRSACSGISRTRRVVLRLAHGRVAELARRRIQVPVSERMWGFKSPLAHEHERTGSRHNWADRVDKTP